MAHAPLPMIAVPAKARPGEGDPWWRFGMVWFMLSGPAIVVVAGFVTLAIAYWLHADVELHETPVVAAALSVTKLPAATSATWQPGEAAAVTGH